MNNFTIISFYTAYNEYKDIAHHLEESLKRFNIDYKLVPIENRDAWESICAYKATFIREQWLKSDKPIVWMDADSTLEQYPKLFDNLDCDFAIHKLNGWEFVSATLYFGKTELAGKLLDMWVKRCIADPINWDQVSLHSAWCDISAIYPLRTSWLPIDYCSIFDDDKLKYPVIKQWQASRHNKTKTTSPIRYNVEGLKKRQNNILWRTKEQSNIIVHEIYHENILKNSDIYKFTKGLDISYPLLEVAAIDETFMKQFADDQYIGMFHNPYLLIETKKYYPNKNIRLTDYGIEFDFVQTTLLNCVSGDFFDLDDIVKRATSCSNYVILIHSNPSFNWEILFNKYEFILDNSVSIRLSSQLQTHFYGVKFIRKHKITESVLSRDYWYNKFMYYVSFKPTYKLKYKKAKKELAYFRKYLKK